MHLYKQEASVYLIPFRPNFCHLHHSVRFLSEIPQFCKNMDLQFHMMHLLSLDHIMVYKLQICYKGSKRRYQIAEIVYNQGFLQTCEVWNLFLDLGWHLLPEKQL